MLLIKSFSYIDLFVNTQAQRSALDAAQIKEGFNVTKVQSMHEETITQLLNSCLISKARYMHVGGID